MDKDEIIIDGKKFSSRLIMGTALYPNLDVLNKSLEASKTEIITVSIRRFRADNKNLFLNQIKKNQLKKYRKKYHIKLICQSVRRIERRKMLVTAGITKKQYKNIELSRSSLYLDLFLIDFISVTEVLTKKSSMLTGELNLAAEFVGMT